VSVLPIGSGHWSILFAVLRKDAVGIFLYVDLGTADAIYSDLSERRRQSNEHVRGLITEDHDD
jgi:hypothetical protein